MKILQKMPIWLLLVIVSFVGIVGAVKTSEADVRKLAYSIETLEGSLDVLQGMAVQVELYDSGSIYWYDTLKNETSIWKSVIPVENAEESVTDYEWGVREQKERAYLRMDSVYTFEIFDILERKIEISDEGGTYYLKDYMKEVPMSMELVREGIKVNQRNTWDIDESTFPIVCPVNDQMRIMIGPKGKTYGNVSESREFSMEEIPLLHEMYGIPMIIYGNRFLFTVTEQQMPSEFYVGTSGIMELHKDGTIEVLYPIPHHAENEEKIMGLSSIGEGKLVLLTEKNHTLLAYCYDIESGEISDAIVLWKQMPEKMSDFKLVFSEQGNYLNVKIQYQEENQTEEETYQYFYGTVLLQGETLECVFSASNIKPPLGDVQILHDQEYKESQEVMYFKDGILYETYAISYLMNEDGQIGGDFYGYADQFYKKGIMFCAFDEKEMIYYGMLKGVHEAVNKNCWDTIECWRVGAIQWVETR